MSKLTEALNRAKTNNLEQWQAIRSVIVKEEEQRRKNRQLENTLFLKFFNAHKGKEFFKFEHLDVLGLEYDVLFVTSAKNVGKTTNIMYNRFKYYASINKRVIFGRCSQNELTQSAPEYNRTANNPFKIEYKNKRWLLLDKVACEPDGKPLERGIAIDFKNSNIMAGGEFEDYGAIIFDEIIPWTSRKDITEEHLKIWGTASSSITRNKKGTDSIKIYLLGNLGGKNDIILDFYGIRRDDQLRYIERGTNGHDCNILYLNLENIYTANIANQSGVAQQMDPLTRIALTQNRQVSQSVNVVTPKVFECFEVFENFVIELKKEGKKMLILVEIREEPGDHYNPPGTNIGVRCREYKPYLLRSDLDIYTDSRVWAGCFPELTYLPSVDNFKSLILNAVKNNEIFYFDNVSLEIGSYIFEEMEKKIKYIIK